MAFETVIQVRFGHVDPAGIVYYPRIYDYVHDVFEELWERHVGARYYQLLLERSIGFPLVRADVSFVSPLRFGDRPVVRVSAFRLGHSSLGLRYLFRVGERLCVDARMTTACIDTASMRSIPIPPEFKTRFAEILEPAPAGEAGA